MDEIKRIAEMFADDLINYKKLGGDLNNMDAEIVYKLILFKEVSQDDANETQS